MKARCLALALSLLLAASAGHASGPYAVTGTASNRVAGHLVRTEYTVQAGPTAIDRSRPACSTTASPRASSGTSPATPTPPPPA